MPRTQRPSGCLILLLLLSVAGVVMYDFMNVDPQGDGGGTRYAALIVFGLITLATFRAGSSLLQRFRPRPRGLAIEQRPNEEP